MQWESAFSNTGIAICSSQMTRGSLGRLVNNNKTGNKNTVLSYIYLGNWASENHSLVKLQLNSIAARPL